MLTRALTGVGTCANPKRPRGEKKPIPEDQKDEKYYERRKRNNQAAKKSRDARKMREDQVKPRVPGS
jgi:primosomal protein N''